MRFLLDIVERATSALADEVMYLVDKDQTKIPIETLENKTKRLVIDDQKQWLRFQKVMRQKGVVTNAAVMESYYYYIRYRDTEDSIDGCINNWKQTEDRLNNSLSRITMRSSMPVMA